MSEVIDHFSKNVREEIFLSLSEYKGHQLIDLRVYVPGEAEGQWIPTRKGISLGVGLYPAFKRALARLEAALIEQGLLDPDDLTPLEKESA